MEDPKPLDPVLLDAAFNGDPKALGAVVRWVNEIIDRRGVNRKAFNEAVAARSTAAERQQGSGVYDQASAEVVNAGLDPLPPKE